MDIRRALILLTAVIAVAFLVGPSNAFIGAGINLNKHLGDTINFNLGKQVDAAGVASGLAGMDLGITWGVNYDLNSLAGYPFGYGGVGAATDANIGYDLGVSMDEAHAATFDGSSFGIPLAKGDMTTTKYNNFIAKNDHISSEQVALPWAGGFPAI